MKRRDFLRTVGALGGALAGSKYISVASATPACTLYPSQTAGPFFFDTGLIRTDIREGRPGTLLGVGLQFIDAQTCLPIPNLVIDLWHTDRDGLYSGYPGQGDNRDIDTSGETFMRGLQVTDSNGMAGFTSVYPGWYPGRVPHIHFKAFFDDRTLVTSQAYFPQELTDGVHGTEGYADRGPGPVTLSSDILLLSTDLEDVLFDITISATGGGISATRTVAVATPTGFTPTPTPTLTPAPQDCTGDCSNDGNVTVNELVRGVNIALGRTPIDQCPTFDTDGSGMVSVSELVAAVNSSLLGCS